MKPLNSPAMKRSLLLLLASLPALLSTVRADDMSDAFNQLVTGRAYLKNYPLTKTRKSLVEDFVGANGQTPNRPVLQDAITRAIAIRAAEPPDPASFSGTAPRSIQAREIAWQALESLGTGYLFAGNKDLLDGIRIAYPGSNAANDLRGMPKDEPATYAGTSQKQLAYARLYFFRPLKDMLDYIARDKSGAVRASGSAYPTMPHYVTFDDQLSQVLPFTDGTAFDDPNFGGPAVVDREASQSFAYLYGSSMERLGMAVISYADQLWRSAWSGPAAGTVRPAAEKQAMLNRATEALQCEIHAQFLATLPMAAQLSDGADNTPNEYQQSRIDQARVSVTDAQRLRDQILAGEKPLQTTLVSAWDTTTIEGQISVCKSAYDTAHEKFNGAGAGHVVYEVQQSERADDLNAEREISLRTNFETRLLEITGVDPSDYGGLRTDEERQSYMRFVQAKFDSLINAGNVSALGLSDGSDMATQALRFVLALRELPVLRARIDSFSQRMRIELERNDDVNATVKSGAIEIGAIDAAFEVASAITYSVCTCGMASGAEYTFDYGAFTRAAQVVTKALRTAANTVEINSINSDAAIQNLLIEQQLAVEELPSVKLNIDIARNELLRLFNQATRLVEDHIFYQTITDTLWYRDPALAFKLEKAEEEYQALVQEYRIELYKLGKMLESAWTEPFRNPVKRGTSISFEPLDNGNYDDFTEPESVFGTPNHVRALAYFNALKRWDLKLREPTFRGAASTTLWDVNLFSGQPISLRRDIFKLIDYRYDTQSNTYIIDPALTRDSIQKFRAILLDKAARDPANASSLSRLRLDFPLTYQQARVIGGQSGTVPIVQRNPVGNPPVDTFWNHRLKEVGIKIVGRNVFAAGSTVPVAIEHYGNVDRVGFSLDSIFTASRTVSTFQVPLYQRDPDKRLVGEPFFGTSGIPAAIGNTAVPMNQVTGWPLFCDNYVLRIGNAAGTLRIENIEDIEFTLKMEVGSPPPINSTIW